MPTVAEAREALVEALRADIARLTADLKTSEVMLANLIAPPVAAAPPVPAEAPVPAFTEVVPPTTFPVAARSGRPSSNGRPGNGTYADIILRFMAGTTSPVAVSEIAKALVQRTNLEYDEARSRAAHSLSAHKLLFVRVRRGYYRLTAVGAQYAR